MKKVYCFFFFIISIPSVFPDGTLTAGAKQFYLKDNKIHEKENGHDTVIGEGSDIYLSAGGEFLVWVYCGGIDNFQPDKAGVYIYPVNEEKVYYLNSELFQFFGGRFLSCPGENCAAVAVQPGENAQYVVFIDLAEKSFQYELVHYVPDWYDSAEKEIVWIDDNHFLFNDGGWVKIGGGLGVDDLLWVGSVMECMLSDSVTEISVLKGSPFVSYTIINAGVSDKVLVNKDISGLIPRTVSEESGLINPLYTITGEFDISSGKLSYADYNEQREIIKQTVLYKNPDKNSSVIKTLYPGEIADILEISDEMSETPLLSGYWSRISSGDIEGWSPIYNLTLYTLPDINGEKLCCFDLYDFTVIDLDASIGSLGRIPVPWIKVRLEDGTTGWCCGYYLQAVY